MQTKNRGYIGGIVMSRLLRINPILAAILAILGLFITFWVTSWPWQIQGVSWRWGVRFFGLVFLAILLGLIVALIWIFFQEWIAGRFTMHFIKKFHDPYLSFEERMAALKQAKPWAEIAGGRYLKMYNDGEKVQITVFV